MACMRQEGVDWGRLSNVAEHSCGGAAGSLSFSLAFSHNDYPYMFPAIHHHLLGNI